ncbi:MAG TPA: hypothetical protein VLT86_11215, partial [Vicinamibacterales bacterium]|nr:hypothetical protein [Vicinamibacterales bacterium]
LSGLNQNFTVSASLGGVTPIPFPTMSGSFGGITYTDTNDRDVTVSSAGFYTARIDGNPVKILGNFNLHANGGDVPGISGQGSPESFGPEAAPQPVSSSIGVSFDFGLTARDVVETPFEFLVVPEPGFAFLFAGIGVIFLARVLRRSTD